VEAVVEEQVEALVIVLLALDTCGGREARVDVQAVEL
jgi:hypothetical protein